MVSLRNDFDRHSIKSSKTRPEARMRLAVMALALALFGLAALAAVAVAIEPVLGSTASAAVMVVSGGLIGVSVFRLLGKAGKDRR